MIDLGDFPANHTAVCIPFDSFAAATGAPSAVTNFANTDVQIYKDGGTTQRSSANGITVSTSFDGSTGLQMIVIDLSENTDAGFYAAGHEYQVAVADITVDGQTLRFWAATFSIERANGILALLKATGSVKVDVVKILGTAPTEGAAGRLAGAFTKFFDKASPTGTINSIPDAVAGANNGLPTTNGTKLNQTVDLTAAAIQAIWDALTSALTTVGSVGKLIVDTLSGIATAPANWSSLSIDGNGRVDAIKIAGTTQSAGDIYARLGAPAGASMSADIAAIKTDTGNIWTAVDTEVAAILAAVDTEVAAIKAKTDSLTFTVANVLDANTLRVNGDATAAVRLALASANMLPGTVDTSAFTPTTTQFEASDITQATADHFKGRIIVFTSGARQYEATTITAYTLTSGKGHFTVTALTTAPANGVTFIII